MTPDTFRLIVSHGTAAFVVVGGLLGLFALMWNGLLEVDIGVNALLLIIGGAVAFLFVQEATKQAELAAGRQTKAANAVTEVTTTGDVQTGGPTTVVKD